LIAYSVDRRSSPPLRYSDRDAEARKVGPMKQDKRSIVRKRTQQLVYLELGRDNGGVMLNLSEDGCSFQAITPVKCGETRFAFQISGGRRISGEAEVVWADDVGILGGLRFLNLPVEARKQIRQWLQETNAPEEPGAYEPAPSVPLDAVARGSRTEGSVEASAPWLSSREQRSSPSPASVRTVEEEAPPPSAWAHLRAASTLPLRDERFAVPLLREDGSFVAPRARSVAMWRALAVLATAVAVALLLMSYQREVGDSLIWLGETLAGKTKASAVVQEGKATPVGTSLDSGTPGSSDASSGTAGSNPSAETGAATQEPEQQKPGEQKPTAPESTVTPANQTAKLNAPGIGGERQESVLEKQVIRDNPVVFDAHESVESLWGAVQGGSVSAERSLAERFVRGDGVVQNCEQAKVLLKAAANRGSREARLRLYELETQGCH
jgi:hypothetical protein